MRFEDQRQLLVKELYHNGISDPLVLHAFAKVPREAYVLPELREYAYRNQPLPIHLKQTISQPLMVARSHASAKQVIFTKLPFTQATSTMKGVLF